MARAGMKPVKIRGVIIHEQSVGEADKRLIILAKGVGKVFVLAKGAKKPGSKLLAGTELFTYADFVLNDGGQFRTLSQADVIERFYGVRGDYESLLAASYFLELVGRNVPEGVEADDFLELLLKALARLHKKRRPPAFLCVAFEFKFLALCGFAPQMDGCTHCLDKKGPFHAVSGNGLVCDRCKALNPEEKVIALSGAAKAAIRYIGACPIQDTFAFTVDGSVLAELRRASSFFMSHHLDMNLKSRRMLEKL